MIKEYYCLKINILNFNERNRKFTLNKKHIIIMIYNDIPLNIEKSYEKRCYQKLHRSVIL